MCLAHCGLPVLFWRWGRPKWLLILVLLVPIQMTRARREARLLEDTFGDAYREYRKRTWF